MTRWSGGFFVLALAIAGCGSAASGPPDIVLDRSACARCGMLISDPRFAAASRIDGVDPQVFDDIGCLLKDAKTSPAEAKYVLWFRDADTGDWIGAGAEPAFVHAESIHTPMGGGIAAFGSRQAAVAFAAAQGGTVIDSAADLLRGAR